MASLSRSTASNIFDGGVSCQAARSLMEAFVDGELSPEQTLEMEAHVECCLDCQGNADFLRALSTTVREIVHPEHAYRSTSASAAQAVPYPEQAQLEASSFMARLERAVEAEVEREVSAAKNTTSRSGWMAKTAALAAAASATLWFGVRTLGQDGISTANGSRADNPLSPDPARSNEAAKVAAERSKKDQDEALSLEGALDRLIDYHSSPPQPQVTSVDLLPELEPDVGVRMQLPKLDAALGARWEGASLVPVRNQRAASFRYRLPKNRVTLYVFNASRFHVHDLPLALRETPQPVYLGQWRGYNVAAKETRGIGYALATDMDGPAVAQLISDIH